MSSFAPAFSRQRVSQYSDLVYHDTVGEYREHFKDEYCYEPLVTFDSVAVTFSPDDFNHAFFPKGNFSWPRAERIDWIGRALKDSSAWLCPGWDRSIWDYNWSRRVSFVNGDYAVVIEFVARWEARLVTAYVADGRTPRLLMGSPRWS